MGKRNPATQSGKTERRIRMREYDVVDTDADNIGGCGICRYKSGKNEGRLSLIHI